MIRIETIALGELARIDAFYRVTGYGGGVSSADLTLAASMDDCLAGAVRLCPEHGVTVLRGMQVASAFQRRGIGRALLDHCIPYLDRGDAWCLPYDHLVAFYACAGFSPAPPESLPPFLARRLAGYLASGQRVLAMHRRQPSG
ncbi:GNAT family N-acetyltransferase [Massilia forsythiae]|uniref:GNAT family N-acetyltransferase n=1 Tax=Massilia forsythiae TaxID=2728020 RepID=A0A7Z2W002_9BURK|nr:GNAT family N-acetyltransferase [Massilia forsythiae]QJE01987.1 GNAT family N-acetyltransferase [Massilia forsythiae]